MLPHGRLGPTAARPEELATAMLALPDGAARLPAAVFALARSVAIYQE